MTLRTPTRSLSPAVAERRAARANQRRADRRVQTVCLLILTVIAVGLALWLLKPVLVPFVLAVLFTYCLTPVIDILQKHLRLPRMAAIASSMILGLAVLLLMGLLVAISVGHMTKHFSAYEDRFNQLSGRVAHAAHLERLGLNTDPVSGTFVKIPETVVSGFLLSVISDTSTVASHGAIVIIFMIFMLIGREEGRRHSGLLDEIELRIKRYVGQTMFFSVLTGVLVTAVLGPLGVEFAGGFGFLAFLLNFIPSVGAVIATLLPLPVVLLSPELSVTAKVLAMAIPGAMQFLMGNIIQPKVQGDALELHPVTILMSLIFFGMIWGIVGAFLATPITAVIKIIFERIPATRPLAAVLAGDLYMLADTQPAPLDEVESCPQDPVSERASL